MRSSSRVKEECGLPAAGLPDRFNRYLSFETALFLIFVATLILRFAFLDLKLYHHDEAIHGWFSYRLLNEGIYEYDPSYHGPLLYYLTAGMFWLLGDSDLVGRLLPSLAGAAIVPLVYALYRLGYLDRLQTLVASLFIALSPDMVYFSRFLRHDIFQLFFTMLLLVALLAYFDRGNTRYALVAACAAAGGMSLKEDMPIILLIFGSYFLIAAWLRRIRLPPQWKLDLVLGIAIVLGVMSILYSFFGLHPDTIVNGPVKAFEHWTAMHGQCRICGPWYFYILLFLLYEVPIFALAIVGAAQFVNRNTPIKRWFGAVRARISPRVPNPEPPQSSTDTPEAPFGTPAPASEALEQKLPAVPASHGEPTPVPAISGVPEDGPSPLSEPIETKREEFFRFSIYWAILVIGAYAYIGEKVPWLILHQLLPLIFVSVYAMTARKAAIAVASCIFLIVMTWHVAFMPVDINEPIVQVQNSEELREVFSLINASQRVAIASDDYWPLPWYYRGNASAKLVYYSKKVDENVVTGQDFDMVITRDDDTYTSLPGFEKRRYKINYWFSYYDNKDRVLEYYFKRDGKMGSMNFDVFIRQPA